MIVLFYVCQSWTERENATSGVLSRSSVQPLIWGVVWVRLPATTMARSSKLPSTTIFSPHDASVSIAVSPLNAPLEPLTAWPAARLLLGLTSAAADDESCLLRAVARLIPPQFQRPAAIPCRLITCHMSRQFRKFAQSAVRDSRATAGRP
jgi:hypothetical protein